MPSNNMLGKPGFDVTLSPSQQAGAGYVQPGWNRHRIVPDILSDSLDATPQ
ncbi:hypothetical protein PTKU64_55980 [Paraburkholderia terrae]|uniref:Uncharacterized protein n=1 Tax=Paraburkholderia terrae TaxID=311230 RepID=A0ABN6JLW7_9BURK|nr:hypothetical protein [Paraburkholderia terrae]BCZ81923.1 hypothetical protein PTKU64_55980 [Paraburkholderia terrae]